MVGQLGYRSWLPIGLTVGGWIALVSAIAVLGSNTWADLVGLVYLVASPFIHRGLKAQVTERSDGAQAHPDTPGLELGS